MGSVCLRSRNNRNDAHGPRRRVAALPESRRTTILKTELAERILAAAAAGERDPERLRARALMRPNPPPASSSGAGPQRLKLPWTTRRGGLELDPERTNSVTVCSIPPSCALRHRAPRATLPLAFQVLPIRTPEPCDPNSPSSPRPHSCFGETPSMRCPDRVP